MSFFNRTTGKSAAKPDSAEIQLIKSAAAGNAQSFAQLVSTYERRVRALGMSFFKNVPDCDDFVQEVFIKVFTGLRQFRGDSQFSTWLMRIAYNTAVNSVKRRKECAALPEDYEIEDTVAGPEERHLRKVTEHVIRCSIAELPEKYRICLDMYFYYDMSYSEISVITDLPVNTIKSHVFRAKKMLKDMLSQELGGAQ